MKRPRMGRGAAVMLALAAFLVAGCGGGGGQGSTVARRPPTPRPRPEREAPPPRRRRRAEPHRRVARCGPGDLVVSHTELGFGALSHYGTEFNLINVSPHACRISGYPKIVELLEGGQRLGGPARHGTFFTEGGPGAVTIAKNRGAVFKAGWGENVYGPGECKPRELTRFRVTLPGSRLAQVVPYPVSGRCTTRVAQETFSVGRIEPPPEERGGPHRASFTRPALPSEGLSRCRDADLLAWTGLDHAAGVGLGTAYSRIDVMNLSDRACAISGIPRLVAVDLHGNRVGLPARESEGMVSAGDRRVKKARIGPHRSGVFTYATGGYYNYGRGGCEHHYAAGFRVTLPGAHTSQYVPAPTQRCLRVRDQLTVGPIE